MKTNCQFCGSEMKFPFVEELHSTTKVFKCGYMEDYGISERTPLCHAIERGNKLEKELAEVRKELGFYENGISIQETQNAKLRTLLERVLKAWDDSQEYKYFEPHEDPKLQMKIIKRELEAL